MNELDRNNYVNQVTKKLTARFPEKFRKYVGINEDSVKEMIQDFNEDFSYIIRTAYDLWEFGISVEDAVEELYPPLNVYFSASASVM